MKNSQFIPASKKRFIRVLIIGVVLIVIGTVGIIFFGSYRLAFKGFGALIFIGIFTIVLSLINIFNKSKGILLDEEGMNINAGLIKSRVLWNNVKTIEEKSRMGQSFLVLILNNNNIFLNQLSSMQKSIAKQNLETVGSPMAINITMLEIDKEKLKSMISNYLIEEKP